MTGKMTPKPTRRELEIMSVLWKRGAGTVREILNELNEGREEAFAYTTILRFLQIMHEKGLVERQEGGRTHVYRASAPEQDTKKELVKDLIDRAFGGSPRDLVLHLIGGEQTSAAEVIEIQEALQELESQENQNPAL